jgi:hypothetical protein
MKRCVLCVAKNHASAHYNVVDRNVNKLHEEADEAHDQEADASCENDLLELCAANGGEGRRRGGGV